MAMSFSVLFVQQDPNNVG